MFCVLMCLCEGVAGGRFAFGSRAAPHAVAQGAPATRAALPAAPSPPRPGIPTSPPPARPPIPAPTCICSRHRSHQAFNKLPVPSHMQQMGYRDKAWSVNRLGTIAAK